MATPSMLSNTSVHSTPSAMSGISIQATHSTMERANSPEMNDTQNDDPDEPPPPYKEPMFEDTPQIAPVEYSADNSPQLLVAPPPDWSELEVIEPPPRNSARLSGSEISASVQSSGSPTSTDNATLVPRPLQIRSSSSHGRITRRPVTSQSTGTTFSSAKAREAGFEIQSDSITPNRTNSNSSIVILPSADKLKHTRESGKLTAYLVPLPKPRLRGIRPEEIPTRFMIYTPPLPPLSKPAAGEKESQVHKTQRSWQEDVRKATVSNASKATWKGMKAKTTILVGKGINLTRSANVEFLDRVSGGEIPSTTEGSESQDAGDDLNSPAVSVAQTDSASNSMGDCPSLRHPSPSTSLDKSLRPKALEDLTLIYPASLDISPESIRTEFIDSLLRTREKSRKNAIVASSLIPFAAGVDACLIATFGGLTQVSSAWAYTSIKGTITSKKVTQGLLVAVEEAEQGQTKAEEAEIRGCTCGRHIHDFGAPGFVTKGKGKGKKKEPQGISLNMRCNTHVEVFKRYLDIKCLDENFGLFPQIEAAAGDVDEAAILSAIGWQPVRRSGQDLDMEVEKGKIRTLTPEMDEKWQIMEAREDIKRIAKKSAAEWVAWCKGFRKDFSKGQEAAMMKKQGRENAAKRLQPADTEEKVFVE
ncbi:hypothetical protein K504DRAFT_468586 [Pleomassaria siparia CBS 279.74]|uniref:Uncharacterized protein n=1 Tax=Pleomassaria siparia CBS 279.74 TaxID=1314801 RepID=A0A6G1K6I3_9PLEO|nr:hypothetical protein K504DRAFT_468586 [Pleomassaria siparia CBS 279.74]